MQRIANKCFIIPMILLSSLSFASMATAGEKKKAPEKTEKAKTPATKTELAKPAEAAKPAYKVDKHTFELVTIEEKVNSLKEKIFRSKAQLMLLQETLLHGVISTSKLILHHKNKMGSSFYLESASYSLDGTPIFTKSDYNGDLNKKSQFILYQGGVQPKEHTISIVLVYRGNGFGVFSYLNRYRFNIKSSYTFKTIDGKLTEIKIVAYEKSRFLTQLKDRPAVRYEVTVSKVLKKKLQNMLKNKK